MKIDGGRIINDFIEPNKRQYAIPVYQRNYEWSREQCVKLFEDIIEAYRKDKLHFCGSVVYALLKQERNILYYVIVDGQQRLTTIYLLLKALIDCASIENERGFLEDSIFNRDKYDTYDVDTASKLKLKPIKSDNKQLYLLMDNKYDEVDKSSGIWTNYALFKELVQQLLIADENMSVKDIYRGIERLTCANIKLDEDDNAQEIFERINSTGVPLSLADQIRNFVLMTDVDQEMLYEEYWLKIEQLIAKEQVSEFFLDYLNMKLDGFAKESTAYEDFKKLFKENGIVDTTINSIVREMDVAKGLFYYYFKSKQDIYLATIEQYLSERIERRCQVLEDANVSFDEKQTAFHQLLQEDIAGYMQRFQQGRDRSITDDSYKLWDFMQLLNHLIQPYAGFIRQGLREGRIDPSDGRPGDEEPVPAQAALLSGPGHHAGGRHHGCLFPAEGCFLPSQEG